MTTQFSSIEIEVSSWDNILIAVKWLPLKYGFWKASKI